MKEEFNLTEESISHYSWPKCEENKIDEKLELEMGTVMEVLQAALSARERAKLGLKWPVKEVVVVTTKPEIIAAVEKLAEIIKKQTNAKSVGVVTQLPGLKVKMRPDGRKIGPAFAELSGQVIAKLTIDSPQTILGHLEKEGVHRFELEGREIKITRDMLQFEHEVPAPFFESAFSGGYAYVNAERTPELESEGYSREVMRNIQLLRKEAGMEKWDRINLILRCTAEMVKRLKPFALSIEEKVGAEKMELVSGNMIKSLSHKGEFKVKEEQFEAWMEKV